MDTIEARFVGFEKLKITCLIGILPHEYVEPQVIFVSLKLALPQELQRNNELSMTIDYTQLSSLCQSVATRCHHGLLETLAADILEELLAHYSLSYLWIRIEKPAAIAGASCAFVEHEKRVGRR